MKLMFKQRLFSWFDSYDIYDENNNTVYTVKGELALGHQLRIYDANGEEVGLVKERFFKLLPTFTIYKDNQEIGYIKKEFTLFSQKFDISFKDWQVDGDFLGWNYSVVSSKGKIMTTTKKIWNLTDVYEIDVVNSEDALDAVMIVLAIDAAKCDQNN